MMVVWFPRHGGNQNYHFLNASLMPSQRSYASRSIGVCDTSKLSLVIEAWLRRKNRGCITGKNPLITFSRWLAVIWIGGVWRKMQKHMVFRQALYFSPLPLSSPSLFSRARSLLQASPVFSFPRSKLFPFQILPPKAPATQANSYDKRELDFNHDFYCHLVWHSHVKMDVCGVYAESIFTLRGKSENIRDHVGNRKWNASLMLCQLSCAVSTCDNSVATVAHHIFSVAPQTSHNDRCQNTLESR